MATQNLTTTETEKAPRFGQTSVVYAANPDATRMDFHEAIDMRLAHLDAALLSIYGGGISWLRNMDTQCQDTYLWMLHSMVEEVRDLMDAMAAKESQATETL